METNQKVLFVDAGTGFYKLKHFAIGSFFGPVDLGLHLAARYNSLNIGAGLLAGSIFPGSNRLVFTGFSPCWGGIYSLIDYSFERLGEKYENAERARYSCNYLWRHIY